MYIGQSISSNPCKSQEAQMDVRNDMTLSRDEVEEPDAHDEAPSPLGGRWNCIGGWISLTAGGVVDLSSLTDRPWHQLIRPSPRDRWIFWGRRVSGIWDVIEKKKLLFPCIISVWQMRSRNQVMTCFWWGDDSKKTSPHNTEPWKGSLKTSAFHSQ